MYKYFLLFGLTAFSTTITHSQHFVSASRSSIQYNISGEKAQTIAIASISDEWTDVAIAFKDGSVDTLNNAKYCVCTNRVVARNQVRNLKFTK